MRNIIYLACPITLGDRDVNFAVACANQWVLMKMGYAVINPALTMKLPGAWEIDHVTWMENSLPQVARCDAVLRLPGESVGADLEVSFARDRGIRVFDSIGALKMEVPCSRLRTYTNW